MGVVIEICIKYPGGRTRIRETDMHYMKDRGLMTKAGFTSIAWHLFPIIYPIHTMIKHLEPVL